mgnify:FL=1
MKKLLFLDDYRNPFITLEDGSSWLVFSPIPQPFEVIWVKSYNEFVAWITLNGLPDAVCYDHDLVEEHYAPKEIWDKPDEVQKRMESFTEKTGYDCAKWTVEYCMDNNLKLPLYNIQSANPVGKANNFLIQKCIL